MERWRVVDQYYSLYKTKKKLEAYTWRLKEEVDLIIQK